MSGMRRYRCPSASTHGACVMPMPSDPYDPLTGPYRGWWGELQFWLGSLIAAPPAALLTLLFPLWFPFVRGWRLYQHFALRRRIRSAASPADVSPMNAGLASELWPEEWGAQKRYWGAVKSYSRVAEQRRLDAEFRAAYPTQPNR